MVGFNDLVVCFVFLVLTHNILLSTNILQSRPINFDSSIGIKWKLIKIKRFHYNLDFLIMNQVKATELKTHQRVSENNQLFELTLSVNC